MDKIIFKSVKKILKYIMLIGVLLLSTLSILAFSKYNITQINIGSGIVFLFVCVNYKYFKQHYDASLNRASVISAVIGTVSLAAGNIIRDMDQSGLGRGFGLTDVLFAAGILVFLFMFMHNLFYLLDKAKVHESHTYQMIWKQCFLLTIVLLVLWLPYYLTFFPGIFGSDPIESIRMGSQGVPWTNHHPILYTAYIKIFVLLFQNTLGINGALGLMIFVQQCILAGTFSYCISFMWKRGIAKWVLISVVLFVSINPVVAVFSVYATKDVLFSASMLLLLLKLYQLQEKLTSGARVSVYDWTGLTIISLLVIFLRNNGSFIVVGTCLYLIYIFRKEWKTIGCMLLVVFCCIILQKQVLFPVLQVEEGSFAESLSIPLQQIGQAVVDGARMTEEEEAFLNQLMPLERMKEVYQAGYTDTIKFDEQFNDAFLNEHKMEFIKVWFGMLPDNFTSYVKAYLLQTAGYWDISQTESLTIYGVVENEFGIKQVDVIEKIAGHSVQSIIEKLVLVCRKLPVLCYLTNMAMMLFGSWIVAFCLQRKKQSIIWLIPLWICWGTVMIAAPASCKFRYMLPMYLALPVILWIVARFGLKQVEKERTN